MVAGCACFCLLIISADISRILAYLSSFHYSFFRASFIIDSRLAEGFSFKTAEMALLTFAFVNPRRTRAVVASSTMALLHCENRAVLSDPPPFTILSLSSRIRRCAVFNPMPLMLFILLMSSDMMAFLISSDDREDSIICAVDTPIPLTPISSLKSSRSSLVANP